MTQSLAFLGLGAMGSRMASRLLAAGFSVTVWNRDAQKAQALGDKGAKIAGTPKAAATGADIIFSMVSDDDVARAVWLDADTGALAGMKRGAIGIECSTVTPAWVRHLSYSLAKQGCALLDAPVAGSRPQAEAGQLVFMVGGDAEVFAQVETVLAPLAANVLHVGKSGQGAVLKLAVNTFFAAQLESLAELLGFMSRNGFEATQAAELLGQFPIVAPPIAGAAKMMAAGVTTPMFTIDLIEKDLAYVLTTAAESGAQLPGAQTALSAFRAAQNKGLGSANISALASVFA